MRRIVVLLCLLPAAVAIAAGGTAWVKLPGGSFRSALKYEDARTVKLAPFELQKRPVTNGEFLAFVQSHPQWRRDKVASVLAEKRYLSHWAGPDKLGDVLPGQPVVQVSWFAASAYCEAQGGRLPTWSPGTRQPDGPSTMRTARLSCSGLPPASPMPTSTTCSTTPVSATSPGSTGSSEPRPSRSTSLR